MPLGPAEESREDVPVIERRPNDLRRLSRTTGNPQLLRGDGTASEAAGLALRGIYQPMNHTSNSDRFSNTVGWAAPDRCLAGLSSMIVLPTVIVKSLTSC